MSPGKIVLIVLAFAALGAILSTIGWNNTSISLENSIAAQFTDNENTYSAFTTSVVEAAGVAKEYVDEFKQILKDTMEERYGTDTKRVTLFIQEHNSNVDATVFTKVQQMIESGRQDFKRSQTTLLDKQRVYQTRLQAFPGSMLAGMLSFPHVLSGPKAPTTDQDGDGKLTVFDYPVIISQYTMEVFTTGTDKPLDPFGKQQ